MRILLTQVILSLLLVSLLTTVSSAKNSANPKQMQVRIALTLTLYKKQTQIKAKDTYTALPAEKFTLRAALDRSNHYYLDKWHLVTRPLSWAKQTRKYQTTITIFRRFGKNNEVEEKIGSVVANGTLKTYSEFYVLQNFQQKIFKDKAGNPKLHAVVGFTINNQGIAKK